MSPKGVEGGKTLDSGKVSSLFGTISESPARFSDFVRGVRREFASAGFKLWAGVQDEQDYVEAKSLHYELLTSRGARITKTFVYVLGTSSGSEGTLNTMPNLFFSVMSTSR